VPGQVPGQQPYGGHAYPWPQQPYPGQPYQAQQPYQGQSHAQQQPYPGQPYQAPPSYVPHYSQQPYAAMPYYQVPQQPAGNPAVDPRRHVRRIAIGGGAAAVIAATLAVGVAFGVGPTRETSAMSGDTGSSSSAGQVPGGSTGSGDGSSGSGGSSSTNPGGPSSLPFGNGGFDGGSGSGGFPGFGGNGGFGSGGSSDGTSQSGAVAATAAQQKGVVVIDSQLQYQQAESAGTGMILSSNGLVLTNNHVVNGATAIQVTDETTGKQYTATVVGTDPSADVALLQLKNASGLTPITLDKDGGVTTGTSITAIGNAEGTGSLVAAAGSVTNTNQTMTAQTETGGPSETLNGLIEFQADVVSGDSGGPVLDSQGEVVGMTTAASNGMGAIDAFAIPIDNALSVVNQIKAGDTSGGITLGYPGFLGVSLASPRSSGFGSSDGTGTTSGATISEALNGTPAAQAGLTAGDTITAVDGKAIASADALTAAMAGHKAGDRVTITWVSGSTGATQSATVTLIAGPAN
jgi:S1-C subfamily serine protease